MTEPLQIKFTRTGGGLPHLQTLVRDAQLSPDDEHAWLGTERPIVGRRAAHGESDPIRFHLEFRRGSERRVVDLVYDDLTAHLRPLVDRLITLAEGR